jgi:minor histocompatibility antigen H13
MNNLLLLLGINFLMNLIVNTKYINKNLSYINLILTALALVYIGTNFKNNKIQDIDVIDENMSYIYPIIMSVFMIGIFCVIKYLPKYKNIIIKLIFMSSIILNLTNILPINDIIIIVLTIAWFTFDYFTKGEYLSLKIYMNNLFALLIAVSSLGLIELKNINTGIILLVGLFFFDIFWVFGSKLIFKESVMESVAVNVDMPLLLKYFYTDNKPIMLGLGDIIIPGLFIKLLVGTEQYIPCLIAYFVSLVSAITANNLSGLPQPALLYIVPAILGTYYLKK